MILATPAITPLSNLAVTKNTVAGLLDRFSQRATKTRRNASKAARLPSVQNCQADLFQQLDQREANASWL